MPQIISRIKDDLKFVLLLSCFMGHPVYRCFFILKRVEFGRLSSLSLLHKIRKSLSYRNHNFCLHQGLKNTVVDRKCHNKYKVENKLSPPDLFTLRRFYTAQCTSLKNYYYIEKTNT